MKSILIILCTVLNYTFCVGLYAQIKTFEFIDYSSQEDICTHVIELENVYLTFNTPSDVLNPSSSSILQVSKSGDFIKKLDLHGYYNYLVYYITNWHNNTLLLDISKRIESDTAKYKRCILITDYELNIISEHCYFLQDFQDGFANKVINGVYKFIFNIGIFGRGNLCFGSFNSDNTLEVNYKNDKNILFPSSLDILPNGNYLIYTFPGAIETDTLFNHITDHTQLYMNIHGTIRKLNEEVVIIAGIDRVFDTLQEGNPVYYKNIIHFLNPDISVIHSDRFDIRDDPTNFNGFNYPAVKQMLDFYDEKVYVASNIEIFGIQDQRKLNRFQILKFHTVESFEREWQMIYGGDAPYALWGMIATTDGGCLVYGMRRDDPESNSYPYVLKVDENGLISSVHGADPLEM